MFLNIVHRAFPFYCSSHITPFSLLSNKTNFYSQNVWRKRNLGCLVFDSQKKMKPLKTFANFKSNFEKKKLTIITVQIGDYATRVITSTFFKQLRKIILSTQMSICITHQISITCITKTILRKLFYYRKIFKFILVKIFTVIYFLICCLYNSWY